MTERGAYRALLVCLLLSGMSGLVYEVAWVRSLELIFGATTFAVATVLASFMGGLAAGSALAGYFAARLERHHPLRIYAAIEAGIAAVALLIPLLFQGLVPVVQATAAGLSGSFALFSLVRFLVCASVLLIPTALMGATLPVVSRFAAGDRGASDDASDPNGAARRVGMLFAVNTAGAVAGCAAAGLLLMPGLGLRGTQAVAVALNLLAATGAWRLARHAPFAGERAATGVTAVASAAERAPADGVTASAPAFASAAARAARSRATLLVGAYAVSGGVAMLMEVAWSRFLVLVLGSSTYSYTIMLTTFLVGLTAGAWFGTRLLRPGSDPVLAVGLCQLLVAVTTFFGLFLAGELPYFYHLIHDAFDPRPRALLLVQMLLSAAVMFLPTLGLGAMFPLTMGGLGLGGARAPRLVARAYAWNTAGAIAGSVAAGFWLIPRLGSRGVLITGIVLSALVAGAAIVATPAAAMTRGRRGLLLGLLALYLANLAVGTPAWRPDTLSSGIFRYADRYRGLDRTAFREQMQKSHGEILLFREGLTCTVTVFRTTQALTMMVNGKPDASVPPGLADPVPRAEALPMGDMPTQVLVAQLPLLLAPRREDVLLIGLGSGVTLGSALTHPVGSVDTLELEHAVVEGSRFFDYQSGAPLRDPRVRLVVNDARNDLLVRDQTYDVIISEPSNPWIPGAASLFTRDFFRVARSRLRPDGVFCQWIQLYELWPEDFQSILRSFMQVFPSVQIWRAGSDAILIAGPGEIPLPVGQLFARATDAVRADLRRIGVRSPEDLLAHFWIGGDDLRAALPEGPINTDDNMRIEFVAPLRMLSRDTQRLERQRRALAGMFEGRTRAALPFLTFPEDDKPKQAEFLARLANAALGLGFADEARAYAGAAIAATPRPDAMVTEAAALETLGRDPEADARRAAAETAFPDDPGVRRALYEAALRAGDAAAGRRQAEALVRVAPQDLEARRALAAILDAAGDAAAALKTIEPVLPALATGPAPAGTPPPRGATKGPESIRSLAGRLLAGAGRAKEAVPILEAERLRRPNDPDTARRLAQALRAAGDAARAAAVERPFLPGAEQRAIDLLAQGSTAFGAGRLDEARAALEEARQYDPDQDQTLFLLARTRRRQGDAPGAIALLDEALERRPDRPWAIGYLSQLLGEIGRADAAAAMAARHRALTASDWIPVVD
ncbi:MAG TPA: fused MFS/spermidine synthase [Dongiaceae bacterium]|nr:fused MFS/spermidine synthase [Dongiaceae bacterium]